MKKLSIQALQHPLAHQAGINLYMARTDAIHALASGNKFYKLNPNLAEAKKQGITRLLSFGGAFSNHIHAFALYAGEQGFETIGIIRGEAEYASNPTLQDAQAAGMQLVFVNRAEYKRRHDHDYLEHLQQRYADVLIIPEGGSSQLAVSGCQLITLQINAVVETDIITTACGTGATFAGIVTGLTDCQRAIGYAALKDKTLAQRVQTFLHNESCQDKKYTIQQADYGGFAKLDKETINFVMNWLEQTGILLDPIYTSKMVRRLMQQIEAGEFATGTTITIIHSGGLQGWRGMKQRVTKLAGEKAWGKINNLLNDIKV